MRRALPFVVALALAFGPASAEDKPLITPAAKEQLTKMAEFAVTAGMCQPYLSTRSAREVNAYVEGKTLKLDPSDEDLRPWIISLLTESYHAGLAAKERKLVNPQRCERMLRDEISGLQTLPK